MKFDNFGGVRPEKAEELRQRLGRLGIDPSGVEESFCRAGGPGGQKVNKTSSAVRLIYRPLNLNIKCSSSRQRSLNRFLALRELAERAEIILSPETSPRLLERARLRRRKAGARRGKAGPSAEEA